MRTKKSNLRINILGAGLLPPLGVGAGVGTGVGATVGAVVGELVGALVGELVGTGPVLCATREGNSFGTKQAS